MAKKAILTGTLIIMTFILFRYPRLPQDTAYHCFADRKTIAGIPNFFNVASNFIFLISGTGLRLQEVGDFSAQYWLPEQSLIRSTNVHLTPEPPISCRCCYKLGF